ncbi:MAG: undecaprenyl-phosphate glucose phosphotransferase [Methanobacteriaceae archaeon]
MIKQNQRILNAILVITDVLVIIIAFLIAWLIRFRTTIWGPLEGYLSFNYYMSLLAIAIPIFIALYYFVGLYRPQRDTTTSHEFSKLFKVNVIFFISFTAVLFFVDVINYSRWLIAIFTFFALFLATMERFAFKSVLRFIRSRDRNLKHILIIGDGELADTFARKIIKKKYLGYKISGFLSMNEIYKIDSSNNIDGSNNHVSNSCTDSNNLTNTNADVINTNNGYGYDKHDNVYENETQHTFNIDNNGNVSVVPSKYILGHLDDLKSHLATNNYDRIIIAIPLKEYQNLNKLVDICENHGVKAEIIPGYYKFFPAKPSIDMLEDMPIINIRHVPLDDALSKFVKKLTDLVFSIFALILTSPVIIIVAIIIKITSPGPIIFKQERVGKNRKPFMMYKFRSMKIQDDNEEVKQWTTEDDPRKTKIGSFIRKNSIDELPQFFNVLKGDMSVVGPRPERPFFVDKFKEEIPKYMVKHQVSPGLTGWAQVHGCRGDTSIKKRIDYDIYYVENWNFYLDIKIMVKTVVRAIFNSDAY